MKRRYRLEPCHCGGTPEIKCERIAEDCMATWVECAACLQKSDEIEDAYGDAPTAAHIWNTDRRAASPSPKEDGHGQ